MGGSSGYLLGYGEEEGRKEWILIGIWRGRGEEVVDTYWDMERRRGGNTEYLVGYGEEEGRKCWILSGIWIGAGEEVLEFGYLVGYGEKEGRK